MRTTERARRQQRRRAIVDRLTAALAGALVVVAVVTLLPAGSQQQITAAACRVLTVGLTDCVARLYTPPVVNLRAMPVCEADGVLEKMVPTVEVQRLRFPQGGELERWAGRDGTIRVVPRDAGEDDLPAPSLADDGEWPTVALLGDVSLQRGGQWVFPGGRGESTFVAELQQVYAEDFQSRSALALFAGGSSGRPDSMSPTLETAVMPRDHLETVAEPLSGPHLVPGQIAPAEGEVRLMHDRGTGTTYTTVPMAGSAPGGAPVHGVLRWARDAGGHLSEVLVTAAWQDEGSQASEVVHLYLPLGAGDDTTAENWLTTSGAVLDLNFLAARSVPPPSHTERLIAAVGSVVLEQPVREPEELVEVIGDQLAQDRRVYGDLLDTRSATSIVRPTPSGGERAPVEVTC